jgi:hypothetical protein
LVGSLVGEALVIAAAYWAKGGFSDEAYVYPMTWWDIFWLNAGLYFAYAVSFTLAYLMFGASRLDFLEGLGLLGLGVKQSDLSQAEKDQYQSTPVFRGKMAGVLTIGPLVHGLELAIAISLWRWLMGDNKQPRRKHERKAA